MTRKFAGRARLIAILPVVFLMASTSLLHAQQVPRFDVFGGYAYRWFDAPSIGYPSHANLSGFNFDGTGYIIKRLGVTVDASGTYGDQLQVYDFMFGPQYTRRRPKSKLYVQGLFGKAENRADIPQLTRTHFTSVGRSYGGGAGYDYDWKDLFSIRVLQVDYFRSSTFKTTQNDIRVSTGIVFHFGHIGHKRKL